MVENRQSLAYWIALQRISGVGPATYQKLLARFGTPEEIITRPNQLTGISDKIIAAIKQPDWSAVDKDIAWLEADDQRHIITIHDQRYPSLLKEISDPPCLLYVQGDVALLSKWQLAIVGSRNPTASGRKTAYAFAEYLAQGGLTITSGLAMGIDGAAHQGALSGGKTIAVVGTGLDRVYPAQHRQLAHDIVANGAIVSEFPLGTSPRPEFFPRRNRIISGMSLGTLIVEAALKSGSLITARMAMEQSREVFAIPGSIHNPLSRGCHQLIREGAKLVETAEDIIEELGALAGVSNASEQLDDAVYPSHEKDSDYQILFEHLGFDPVPIDTLIENTGLTADAVSSMLLLLELESEVESLPGGRYVRTGS
ncbi:MAG TPA: DNA-protecting protein DprA [Methylophaga aminisulfidivorans]|uniref:DNA-protecting protein DprA n=1 Tax=Methylophaga aminisulfidivorans TaxID=230105 RepID=A0A7C1W339_9GAMM|nr:DNA-protecting protein DprA [Methylophaga aminisulfidivorans]